MDAKKAGYTIITARFSNYSEIRRLIEEGWIPVGAPDVNKGTGDTSQAMYKPPSASSLTPPQGGSGRSRRTRRRR